MRLRYIEMVMAACLTASIALSCTAAETVVVRPSSAKQTGWVTAYQVGKAVKGSDGALRPAEAVAEFERGYGTPPLGSGSLHLYVGSGEADPLPKVYVGTNKYAGVRLDQITQFKVCVCPRWWCYTTAQPVTVEIAVAKGRNLRLCTFYPWGFDPTGYYGRCNWREVDLMSPAGCWEITHTDSGDNRGNWQWLVQRLPASAIMVPSADDWPRGTLSGAGVNVKIGAGQAIEARRGSWWRESSGCNCYVDKFTIGHLDSAGKEIVTIYDFESD